MKINENNVEIESVVNYAYLKNTNELTREDQKKYERLAMAKYNEFKHHKSNMERYSKEFIFFNDEKKERNKICAQLVESTKRDYLLYTSYVNIIRAYFLGELLFKARVRKYFEKFEVENIKKGLKTTEEEFEKKVPAIKVSLGMANLDKYKLRFTVESEDK